MTQLNQANSTAPPPVTVVEPGQGRAAGPYGGLSVVFKLWGEDTNGYVSVVEHPFEVGALVEPHLHTREDEYSIVTEVPSDFGPGDREVVLEAGGVGLAIRLNAGASVTTSCSFSYIRSDV
jgi:hypothetical protein